MSEAKNWCANRRILIAEDNLSVALHLEDVLSENGCRVFDLASSVPAAFTSIAEHGPDAVLLDVSMEGVPTCEVAKELKDRGIPFVIVTGHADLALTNSAFEGAPVVEKPWKEADVLRSLAQVLETPSFQTDQAA
jgi:CheY-like chemotaxis protein